MSRFNLYLVQLLEGVAQGDKASFQRLLPELARVFFWHFVKHGRARKEAEEEAVKVAWAFTTHAARKPIEMGAGSWIGAELRALDFDQEDAGEIQALLLGSVPVLDGLEIGVGFRPSLDVSGDSYAFHADDDRLLAAVMDAKGKGLAAGLYAQYAHGALMALANDGRASSPADIVLTLSNILYDRRASHGNLSMMLLEWRKASDELLVAGCGNVLGVHIRTGHAQLIQGDGFPLGMLSPAKVGMSTVPFRAGDSVVIFTDGVTDQENRRGEPFGLPRTVHATAQAWQWRPADLLNHLWSKVDLFAEDTPRNDDQTALVLKAGVLELDGR